MCSQNAARAVPPAWPPSGGDAARWRLAMNSRTSLAARGDGGEVGGVLQVDPHAHHLPGPLHAGLHGHDG